MSFVYFIQAGGARGHVKIGFSKNVEKRLDTIRTSNPLPLRLLHQVDHGEDAPLAEKNLHEALADLRVEKSEWFRWSPDIKAVIQAMKRLESKLGGALVPADFDITWYDGRAEIVPRSSTTERPDLVTANGIGVGFGHADPPSEEQIDACATWLREHAEPCSRLLLEWSSYTLKHIVERKMGRYVSNGAFIEACARGGYRIHRCDATSLNAWIGLRLREEAA